MLDTDLWPGALSGHNLAAVTKANGSTSAYSTCTETWSRPVGASQKRKTGKIPKDEGTRTPLKVERTFSTCFYKITIWKHNDLLMKHLAEISTKKSVFQHRSRAQSIIRRFPTPQFWDDTALIEDKRPKPWLRSNTNDLAHSMTRSKMMLDRACVAH